MSQKELTQEQQPRASGPEPRQWVERYADHLYSYAFARLDDEEQARDLVQETFLAALEKVGQFQGNSSERTWLTAILKYKIIDLYRRRNSGLRTERLDEEPEQEFFEQGNGHWIEKYYPRPMRIEDADPLVNKELAAILRRCLKRLPALWLSVFTMRHMDDAATETICKELKVTPANFWVIIHRAKLNLRACIQKSWQ
ncbi:MAG: sigma-70 family RNA polymerase sigma factor [Bacteroidota bacterium]|nr:sigma-70 family RNA polymerase sigma factor [Bacteroidota bacterium]MDP4217181.1 sigma-70 family RNA polymerase sigma factor [Bacteroidota bacterium]MDP4245400.1 sigma-70 family RNA polymerase sigma factor [Bacteroidota bacterium]MDP4254204.1 sigma-70 family RNA polymerase sigma factor [Bacteroidota bacterium]MDP4259622.1 sigma-70 family RNA polymerase sigma factor [Bacteroidota bacterium]